MISLNSTKTTTRLKSPAKVQSRVMGVFCARIIDLCKNHWDFNALWQLRKDAIEGQALFNDNDNIELRSIFEILNTCLNSNKLPDANQVNLLLLLSQEMQIHGIATLSEIEPILSPLPAHQVSRRIETPPKLFWHQWAKQTSSQPTHTKKFMGSPAAVSLYPSITKNFAIQRNTQSKIAKETIMHDANTPHFRIYHLSDYNKLSIEIDLLIENAGMDIELLESLDELIELLQALPADLVLIDASFLEPVETISAAIAQLQKNNTKALPVLQITDENSTQESTLAATASYNACVNASNGPAAIVSEIEKLLRFGKKEQYRVLIVEDDRSQAMFAEGILRNAEIITRVLLNSDTLLQTIEDFLPDLILMDLYMPNASGIELTALIRKSTHFQNTPIVFLSGEIDEDKQVDALEAGGDDFLIKPIRPRRLIAAVQNRIKRHRILNAQSAPKKLLPDYDQLIQRSEILEQIAFDINNKQKALFLIEISSYSLLEGKFGITSLEIILKEFSEFLIQTCAPKPVARFGESSFLLVYEGDSAITTLSAYATKLKVQLMSYQFTALDETVDLKLHIGICLFESAEGEPDLLIDIAMRNAKIARNKSSGIEIFKPKCDAAKERDERLIQLMQNIENNNCLFHIYQPIVAVGGSDEKQYQSLIRLKDLNNEIVTAAEFIPLAEKNKLVVAIDRWSLTKITNVILDLTKNNEEIKFFISQSKQTLADQTQLNWLINLLKTSNIPPNSLVIEITHDDALHNLQSIKAMCNELTNEKVQFCLSRYNPKRDDQNVIDTLPINYLKLDHKLNVELSSQSIREELKALVDNAHKLGIEVIGHSVEDAQTAATLWINGIDFIQGNLIQAASVKMDYGFDQAVL